MRESVRSCSSSRNNGHAATAGIASPALLLLSPAMTTPTTATQPLPRMTATPAPPPPLSSSSTAAAAAAAALPACRVEMSYSSLLLLSWAMLLAVLAARAACYGETLVMLALCAVALRTTHGESRLLMPLLLLSELCLTRAMSLTWSPMPFYASSLLSYLTCLPPWTGCNRDDDGNSGNSSSSVLVRGGSRLVSALLRFCCTTGVQHSHHHHHHHDASMRQTTRWPRGVRAALLTVACLLACAVLAQACGVRATLGALAYVAVGCAFWHHMHDSLTDNETVLVSSLVGFYFADACTNNVLASNTGSVSSSNDDGTHAAASTFSTTTPTTAMHLAGRATVLFAMLLLLTLSSLADYCRVPSIALSKSSERRYSPARMTAVFYTAAVVYGGVLCRVLAAQLQQSPWSWLYAYLVASRFRTWALLLWLTCIPAIIVVGEHRTSGLRKTVRRKFFHLIAVVAFTPAALVDPPFLGFALTTATSLAVVVETARHFRVYGTDVVTRYTSRYIDDRDSVAGVVRTHIYLIFGLGLPLYMQYRYDTRAVTRHGYTLSSSTRTGAAGTATTTTTTMHTSTAAQQLLELCTNVIPGITALGVVDASAAIIGSSFLLSSRRVLGRYLRNRLFTDHVNASITHKTTTGTLGGLLCGVLFWSVVVLLQRVPLSLPLLYTFTMVAVCTLTECFMDGVDNLQMPLVALGAVNSLFALLMPARALWPS